MADKPYMVIDIEVFHRDLVAANLRTPEELQAYLARRGLMLDHPVAVSQSVDRYAHCYHQAIPQPEKVA